MKKMITIFIIFILSFAIGISQMSKDTVKNKTEIKDTLKQKEYKEYQRKQQNISKNLDQMDKSMEILDKQKIQLDSIFKVKKIK